MHEASDCKGEFGWVDEEVSGDGDVSANGIVDEKKLQCMNGVGSVPSSDRATSEQALCVSAKLLPTYLSLQPA